MDLQKYWKTIARNKAATDWQDNPEGFLKGTTNGYTQGVDGYMWRAYEDERQLIITELRRNK